MKIAVITGASSGMGRETVLQLSDHFPGFDEMWVIARREERLKELAAQCPVRLRCLSWICRRRGIWACWSQR